MAKKTESKNDYVNRLHKERAEKDNLSHYYVRSGKCDWEKCQSACCRFRCYGKVKASGKITVIHEYEDGASLQFRMSNGYQFTLGPFLCPSMGFNGACALHNKKSQPYICQYFPMNPDDGVYIALKHICGYKFKKAKNEKYKKPKKKTMGVLK